MKALYYLESAQSININGQPIPAKELKWKLIFGHHVAYEDRNCCDIERMDIQKSLNHFVVRVKKAGLIENIRIRLNAKLVGDWVLVTD